MQDEDVKQLLVQLVVIVLFGAICSAIAHSKGRSALGWFFVGLLTNCTCIGLILVLVLPDLKVEEERRRRLSKENRRLKEALRKDRQVSDQRHVQSQRRLAAHDRALQTVGSSATVGATLIANMKVPRVDVVFAHPMPVVRNHDLILVGVDRDFYLLSVGVP